MSDMIALLNDLSYIPPNNEQNEPIQEDIGETSNEPTQAKRNEFEELYASANESYTPVLGQTKNEKCLKPQAAYSFTPENQKFFCQFIKGVKLPDGFRSCFKNKVTDNDTNITGLKSHDCHIMMQRLLPYGLQNYLPDKIAKPIIELCSLFKQICSTTLMEDDMLKAQIKVVDILCDLELIYPPALFDIMIHLVIHLPLEALEGGPIRPRWMFPFERYMKKLKGYVRNKAKPEGSIAEGYVAEEALTFSSHYFRDVTTKFNRPDRNVDPPPPTCQFQVFRSVCKSIGLRSVIRFDAQELKKVKWYVLHNSPEIDTYRSQFKSLFPNKDMKEEFLDRFGSQICQRHIDNDKDPEVSTTSELFALACGPTWTPISINSYVVDGVTCTAAMNVKTTAFVRLALTEKCIMKQHAQIDTRGEAFKNDQYILVTQVKQVFYLEDKVKPHLKVVKHINHKKFSDGGVIVVEDDPDIIYFDNSSDLPLSTSLNDLDNATLHIDGQSTEVDAPPDIIDVVDEDDDIIDDEDALPHDLADFDDEDLINVDDDGVDKMSADVARSHGGDGGGEDRPPPHHVPTGCMGCFANRGKGKRKPNLGGRAAGRLNTRDKTRNLSLKEITDKKGPVPIRFELRDKQTVMPLGDHAAHWSSYIGEVIRGVPLYYPSWLKVPKERKAALITDIGTQFDLRPHMESPDWTEINSGIQQHLQKAYNTNKASFKAQHWVIDPTTGTYDVEKIRRARPKDITTEEWEKYIKFWNDPRNIARAAQNRQNRAKSTVISQQGSRSLARLRDEMRQSSGTQEYPSIIDTFFMAHTINGEFLRDEDRRIYEEMRRLEATGTYTDDEINRLARRGKQRGHIPGVGRVLPARATAGLSMPVSESTLNSLHKKVDFMMSLFKSDSKYSDMFSQFESGGASGSGGYGDDEESVEAQENEDEDGDGDSYLCYIWVSMLHCFPILSC
ncbi:putative reverse transcriptase domain, ribonuclease H-like domain, aspartic peptidase domain protein [Tanacetum coccineum]